MNRTQTIWKILWDRAAQDPAGREPFEIAEVMPAIVEATHWPEAEARRRVHLLLGELDRLPEGGRYFTLEGEAVVPLAEFRASAKDEATAHAAYPFEV